MLTEAVTKAIVTIKDLHHSISFPSWFREPVLFTSCFLKLAGCNTARSPHLSHVADIRTACDRVGDSSDTDLGCRSHFTAVVPAEQTWKGDRGRSGLKCRAT